MAIKHAEEHAALAKMLEDLDAALGLQLSSVVLYGSAARGDFQEGASDLNLLVVVADLEPQTLERLGGPVKRWERSGQPPPKLFSPELIADSADVFPLEFLDIQRAHRVLHGTDPFASIVVHRDHLRVQCERELREKIMLLRQGYLECHGRNRELRGLLAHSYTTFLALFRGCLYLLGHDAPVHNDEVLAAFCARAGLDRAPFDAVDRLRRGDKTELDLRATFSRYYAALTRAVGEVDRFQPQGGGQS